MPASLHVTRGTHTLYSPTRIVSGNSDRATGVGGSRKRTTSQALSIEQAWDRLRRGVNNQQTEYAPPVPSLFY